MPILVEITYGDTVDNFKYLHKFGEKVMIVPKGICY
jgi:hypothetical protein